MRIEVLIGIATSRRIVVSPYRYAREKSNASTRCPVMCFQQVSADRKALVVVAGQHCVQPQTVLKSSLIAFASASNDGSLVRAHRTNERERYFRERNKMPDRFHLQGQSDRQCPLALLLIDVINDMEFEPGE